MVESRTCKVYRSTQRKTSFIGSIVHQIENTVTVSIESHSIETSVIVQGDSEEQHVF